METITRPKDELRQIIKEALSSVLTDNKNLLETVVAEAILDLQFGMAMEEGDTGEHTPAETIMAQLDG